MKGPKISISECTTWTATFEEDLKAYRDAGATGIGIWEFKLPAVGDDVAIEHLRESGLAASVCLPTTPTLVLDGYFTEPREPAERLKAMCASFRRLATFSPACVVASSGDPAGWDVTELRRIVVNGLKVAADVAGECGLILAYEPLRKSSGSLVNTIPDAMELIDEVGAPNLKLLVDTWHVWDLPNVLDDLTAHASSVAGVQIADWRNPTRGWCDRVLPGDGVIDMAAIVAALSAGGFAGWYDIEIFSDNGTFGNAYPDSLWAQEPASVARKAVRQFRQAFDAAGLRANAHG